MIAALAVGALGSAIVFDKVLSTTGGSALVVATNLAYPLADLLLLALIVAMFALTGWRVDRTWALVAAGYAVFAVADTDTSTRPLWTATSKAASSMSRGLLRSC